jgi:hypothetical protein
LKHIHASVAYRPPFFVLQHRMVDSPDNLMLMQLRAIRADISDVQGTLGEIRQRLTNLEGSQAAIIHHLGQLAAADAQHQLATDGVTERLVRRAAPGPTRRMAAPSP